MLYPTGVEIPFLFQYTASKAGASGLTVTISVVRIPVGGGANTVIITKASNTAATEVDATNQPGLYRYLLAGASTGTAGYYAATAHTAGTCDLSDIPALEIVGPAWVQTASAAASPAQILLTPSNLLAVDGSNRVTVGTNADKTGYALSAGEHTAIAVDAQTGLTAQGYTTTRAGYLDTLNGLVAAVWAAATRTLSAFAFTPTVGGYAGGQDPATLVLDPVATTHNTAGTIGAKINSAGAAADPWAVTLPGAYTGAQAGAILPTRAVAGSVILTSAVALNGDVTIKAGDDYGATPANLQTLPFPIAAGACFDLTGATITFYLDTVSGAVGTGRVVTASGSAAQAVAVDLTATQSTALLTAVLNGTTRYAVVAVSSSGTGSKRQTIAKGTALIQVTP